MQAIGNILDMI